MPLAPDRGVLRWGSRSLARRWRYARERPGTWAAGCARACCRCGLHRITYPNPTQKAHTRPRTAVDDVYAVSSACLWCLAISHLPAAISQQPAACTALLPLGRPAGRLSTRRLLQAVRGSRYEGGWRFHVELESAGDAARAPAAPGVAPPSSPPGAAGIAAEPPVGAPAGMDAAPSGAAPQPAPNADPGMAAAELGEPAAAAPAAAGRGAAPAGDAPAAAGDAPGQPPAAAAPVREHAPERDWAPLLYAPAAGEAPAVALRRPLARARPPTPAREWAAGDRAEARPAPAAAATVPRPGYSTCVRADVSVPAGTRGAWRRRAPGEQRADTRNCLPRVARVHRGSYPNSYPEPALRPSDARMAQPQGLV